MTQNYFDGEVPFPEFWEIEYPFIAFTPRSTLTQSGSTCWGPIMDQLEICNHFQNLNRGVLVV